MNNKDLLYWIWFAQAMGPGNNDSIKLLKHYESLYDLYRCEDFERELFPGLSEHTRDLLGKKDLGPASEILETCEKYGIEILTYRDKRYPNSLRDIQAPPVLLYYRGTLPNWNQHLSIGIVGTRKMTAYGLYFAYKIAYEMACTETVIVSGMASGIDGVAAAAALKAGGKTVAVLGSGLDIVYPYHHTKLKSEIEKKGVVLSEYPPGTEIKPYHFPTRNRIISGLSQGTLVVEAGMGSGSLITARDAMKQGRDVYAIPSNVGRDGAEGTNELLREGASMILESEDILSVYKYIYAQTLRLERLPNAKKNSEIDTAYLRALDIAVFDPSERRRNGPPFVQSKAMSIPDRSTLPIQRIPPKSAPGMEKEQASKSYAQSSITRSVNSENAKETSVKQVQTAAPTVVKPKESAAITVDSLTEIQKAILEAIPMDRAISADMLGGLDYPYGDIVAELTMLEIMGVVQKLPGALYTKI